MRIFFLTIAIFISGNLLFAQEDTTEILNDKIFRLLEDASENIEDGDFYSIIEKYLQNPIDINKASLNDLLQLPFLNPNDAKMIIKARNKKKGFKNIYELKQIKNLHPDLISLLTPFIKITKPEKESKPVDFALQFCSRFISDLQTREGYKNGKYLGSKAKVYNRLKFSVNNFQFGLLMEKDPAEKSFYDFYSGFAKYESDTFLRKIILGDYNFEFGQGLIFWSPYAFAKGSATVNSVTKRGRDFYPHTSTEENKFLRGGALSLAYNNFTLNTFISKNLIDASLTGNGEIKNFGHSGYHRIISEINKKDNIEETTLGFSLNYNLFDNHNFSLLHYWHNFNKSRQNSKSDYRFTSLAYNLDFDNFLLSGEIANSENNFAFINNMFLPISDNVLILASIRKYPNNFLTFFGNGFGETNKTQNELGYYVGAEIKTQFGLLNFYYDIFQSPAKNNYTDFPSGGNDFLFNYEISIGKGADLSFKFKTKTKEAELLENNLRKIINKTKNNYRIQLSYKLNKFFFGRTRFELINYLFANSKEKGFLTYQDVRYKFNNIFSFVGRIMFFKTDSYNSRVYEFENDLLGVMTNLPMFGEGFRWYILINYSPIKKLKLNVKYSETIKANTKSISSGNSKIIGNTDNRLSLQLNYNF